MVLDASGPTGGFRRWGMGKGWFMGVPGWVCEWPGRWVGEAAVVSVVAEPSSMLPLALE